MGSKQTTNVANQKGREAMTAETTTIKGLTGDAKFDSWIVRQVRGEMAKCWAAWGPEFVEDMRANLEDFEDPTNSDVVDMVFDAMIEQGPAHVSFILRGLVAEFGWAQVVSFLEVRAKVI